MNTSSALSKSDGNTSKLGTFRTKVFISWSGDRSKHVARALRKWIPFVLQSVEPWMSEQDIKPGTRWANELASTLASVDFGIICLTPETINTPWVLFETGALAKALDHSVVCPYLIELEPGALKAPLNQFNAIVADEAGTLGLFRAMNGALPNHQILRDEVLEETFHQWWPKMKEALEKTPSAPAGHSILLADQGLGLEYVAESRGPALEIFKKYIDIEAKRGKEGRISMIGTSMRGFLVHAGGGFSGREILREAVKNHVELRLMLVDPKNADLRAPFEGGRPRGKIPEEIRSDVAELKQLGIPRESVHYYGSGPTVFGIATSDRMLLNPYPSCLEAHAGFTLIARKTSQRSDIFQQYIRAHFDDLWRKHSTVVPDHDWHAPRNGNGPKNARKSK